MNQPSSAQSPPASKIDVLDVTLRDGSYLIDFQFTAQDTANIVTALESVGIGWIEIGHGLGLHASEAGKGTAAATDEAYMEATAGVAREARWGMFCIPGIARLEDLRLAACYKMPFVRVGADVRDLEKARPFLALAKELGFYVSCNAMKSYAATPSEFGEFAAGAAQSGADIVCLVDSAGGMFPEDITSYLRAARGECDADLGFHGHDNLSLAMANTLRAIEEGAVIVDSSLQGMGRSAGNTVTEALVAILKQRGELSGVDLNGLMDVGQGLIRPLIQGHGLDPMAITSGYARFHSSFTAKVKQYAEKFGLDPRDLIVRLTQEDMFDAPDELLERIGHELATEKIPRVVSIPLYSAGPKRTSTGIAGLEAVLNELRPRSIKSGKFSALNVVAAESAIPEIELSANIQSASAHVIAAVTYSGHEQLEQTLRCADGRVDIIFLDVDRKSTAGNHPARFAREVLQQTQLLTYFDSKVWVDAVEDQVVRLMEETLDDEVVVIAGDHPKSRLLALQFANRGAKVVLLSEAASSIAEDTTSFFRELSFDPEGLDVISFGLKEPEAASWIGKAKVAVVWTREQGAFDEKLVEELRSDALFLDAGVGATSPEALEVARQRGAVLVRVNIWPALAGALTSAHESFRASGDSSGRDTLDSIPIVAGGGIGRKGDIIVDNLRAPTRVIGVADGGGGVLSHPSDAEAERVRLASDEINRRLMRPRPL